MSAFAALGIYLRSARPSSRAFRACSLVPLQLALPPMMILAIRIKHPNVAAVQCPHEADACKLGRAAQGRDQDQGPAKRGGSNYDPNEVHLKITEVLDWN